MDRGWMPNVEISPSCPRCGSSNTKFCYYNNYSLTQPRYFCKGCRRYWTKGGSLRNVPVGGGCRKNRRGNKSFRLSANNGVVHSRSFDDLIISKHPYDHGLPERVSQDDSSSASHIDLARVYANFLNPQPDSKASGFNIPELQSEYDQSLGLTTDIYSVNSETIVGLPEDEQGLVACLNEAGLSDNDHFMYYSGLGSTSTDKQQDITPQNFSACENPIVDTGNNNGLPPLPGEDHLAGASQVILSCDSAHSPIKDDHTFQVPQQSVPGSEILDPDHLFFGNWSPFQFSR